MSRRGDIFLNSEFYIYFVFDDLHLQIIASISPKASVENSSAQWAIFIKKSFVPNLIKYFCKVQKYSQNFISTINVFI